MTRRERMLAALRGQPTPSIPWVPRLDLWYNARKRAGTLPDRYRHATLRDLVDDLGWGYHGVIPDFRDLRDPSDDLHRPLGIYNLHTMPCHTIFHDVHCEVRRRGDETETVYRTPAGALQTRCLYNDTMRRAGITISHVTEYPVKTLVDLEVVRFLFEHAEAVPNETGFAAFRDYVGDRGVAVGFGLSAASGMHMLQRDLMPLERFFEWYCCCPEALTACALAIDGYLDRMLQVLLRSEAEVVLLGANYDSAVTYPPFFEQHLLPGLARWAGALHTRGRWLLTHADGENRGLLDLYVRSGVDIADSVCPAPMTRLSLREVREAFSGSVTILGGIPSVNLLEDCMPGRAFDAWLDAFLEDLGRGDHIILGISDTTPPAAPFERLCRIAERVAALGPVRPA